MLKIKKQSLLSKLGDKLMLPIMYFLQGNFREVPQRTHKWNNVKYPIENVNQLISKMICTVEGDENATRRWFLKVIPIFHMPIFGGWKRFIVLEPVVKQDFWYVGWVAGDTIGVSQIQLNEKVRLLKGPGPAQFFGINEHGEQIDLKLVGEGVIGGRHNFNKVILL